MSTRRATKRSATLCAAIAAGLIALSPARADAQTSQEQRTWGWWIVGGSVMVGTTFTLLGLNVDCTRTDFDCQREASVLIWGGIGFASLGSIAGITIVEWGDRQRARSLPPANNYSLVLAPSLGLEAREAVPDSLLVLRLTAP